MDLNHVVQMVGYTEDAWIVRNSWGTGWEQCSGADGLDSHDSHGLGGVDEFAHYQDDGVDAPEDGGAIGQKWVSSCTFAGTWRF